MLERKRYNYPPIIPGVGQVVQVQFDKSDATDVIVKGRRTEDGKTFTIWFDWMSGHSLVLKISPYVSGIESDDEKPYWRTSPCDPHDNPEDVSLFFFD